MVSALRYADVKFHQLFFGRRKELIAKHCRDYVLLRHFLKREKRNNRNLWGDRHEVSGRFRSEKIGKSGKAARMRRCAGPWLARRCLMNRKDRNE